MHAQVWVARPVRADLSVSDLAGAQEDIVSD